MGKSLEELQAENEMLRREIKVTREAADITADFVVKQFEQTERMLRRFQVAESERQAVLDAATQLSIIATDLDGKIQLFSRGASTLLGYKARDMVGKANILSLHLQDELESYGSKVSGVVDSSLTGMAVFGQYAKQKRARVREWLYTCQDGSFLPVNLSITSLYDSEGRMIGYLFTAMDLSAQNQLEFELRKAKNIAESANASKGDFLARMSHEIRTPMNGIIGMTHLLRKTELNIQQHNYADKVLKSANTLLRLINDILDFSKIDAGKLELESISFNLQDVLDNVTNVIGIQSEEKGLEFLFHIEPQVPYNLIGDPLRLGQVLMNLAGNAVKFTAQGEIVIAVTIEEHGDDSVVLQFAVQDTGIGLQAEQQDHLFTAFKQADDSITRKFGGTGLGLAICKQLTEMMGGRIWVESEPDQGSDFTFTARFGLAVKTGVDLPDTFKVFQDLRALVVDDNKTARDVLISILTSLKIKVDSTNNGKSAIRYLEEAVKAGTPYDVVLLDWIMPEMDGIETARRIKANGSLAKAPVMLMVTANGREEAFLEAEKVGIGTFLLKPVYRSVIYNTLLQILNMKTDSDSRTAEIDSEEIVELQNITGARILLVDDNPINQEVGIALLEDIGMVVEVASNGRESLAALSMNPFDLVLMDIQMPVMDGLEATRQIRQNNQLKDIPIIAMTAHAMAGDREKSLAAGMNEHINKPIDPSILYQALKQWLPVKINQISTLTVEPDMAGGKIALPPVPGIDQNKALRLLNNNSQLFLKMLEDFRNSFSSSPTILQEMSVTGDWQNIREKIHSIKGVSCYIGALSLFNAAAELENILANEELQKAPQKLSVFIKELETILSSLNLLPYGEEEKSQDALSTTTKQLDRTIVTKEVQKVIHLLKQGELAAEEQFLKTKEMLVGLGHERILSDIAEMIDNIDYQNAAHLAVNLLHELQQQKG